MLMRPFDAVLFAVGSSCACILRIKIGFPWLSYARLLFVVVGCAFYFPTSTEMFWQALSRFQNKYLTPAGRHLSRDA